LIELHGGRIGIVSKPNVGTMVTVYLPASRLRR
jgi:signal transduction histidine kinase